ncbi:MAG: hypothetical protein JWM65_1042 [Sphingomonas bacterium]|nr:hypothetical protein [Sphingomonas bacterium]
MPIDFHISFTHPPPVLKLFRQLLFMGVLLGLIGNGVASASPVCIMNAVESSKAMAGMADDKIVCCAACDERDGKTRGVPKSGCALFAGSASMLTMRAPSAVESLPSPALLPTLRRAHAALPGRTIAPEPEPPTQHG